MKVNVTMPTASLGRSDVTFSVHTGEEKLGELRISKGSLVWFPINTKKGYRLSWSKLADLMTENGVKCEKR